MLHKFNQDMFKSIRFFIPIPFPKSIKFIKEVKINNSQKVRKYYVHLSTHGFLQSLSKTDYSSCPKAQPHTSSITFHHLCRDMDSILDTNNIFMHISE